MNKTQYKALRKKYRAEQHILSKIVPDLKLDKEKAIKTNETLKTIIFVDKKDFKEDFSLNLFEKDTMQTLNFNFCMTQN